MSGSSILDSVNHQKNVSGTAATRPLLFVFAVLGAVVATGSFTFGEHGTNDFIEYWSAFRLAVRGSDPYAPAAMLELQRTVNPDAATPLMMWNPPWLLVLFSPLLALSFEWSARLFAITEIVFWCGSALLLLSVLDPAHRLRAPLAAAGALVFFPIWTCMQLGQISLFLLFCASLAFWAWKNERLVLAGIAFAFCALKPHLVYLPAVLFLWWSVRSRRLEGLLAGAAALVVLAALTRILLPSAFEGWIQAITTDREIVGVVHPKDWQVATLVGRLRLLLEEEHGAPSMWVMPAVPGASIFVLGLVLIRSNTQLDITRWYPPLLATSVFFSPYGWIFDQSMLLPLQLDAIVRSSRLTQTPRLLLRVLLFGLTALCLVLQGRVIMFHHEFWFLPAAFLALWLGTVFFERQALAASGGHGRQTWRGEKI